MQETWLDTLLREVEVSYWCRELDQLNRYRRLLRDICDVDADDRHQEISREDAADE